jgi:hypothetical protein
MTVMNRIERPAKDADAVRQSRTYPG